MIDNKKLPISIFILFFLSIAVFSQKSLGYLQPEADFDKAIMLMPNFGAAYLNRGICKEMQRKFEEAVSDWNKAYSLGILKAKNYVQFYE